MQHSERCGITWVEAPTTELFTEAEEPHCLCLALSQKRHVIQSTGDFIFSTSERQATLGVIKGARIMYSVAWFITSYC